eukprot:5714824-Amphidinium_carterae.1
MSVRFPIQSNADDEMFKRFIQIIEIGQTFVLFVWVVQFEYDAFDGEQSWIGADVVHVGDGVSTLGEDAVQLQ